MQDFDQKVGSAVRSPVRGWQALSGGCVADVRLASLADGRRVVVKAGEPGSKLDIEGRMLRYLAEHSSLPVPEVFIGDDDLLVMAYIEHGGGLGREGERHAAEILAALHNIKPTDAGESQNAYGLGFDTLIGGLPQPNGWDGSWASFFGKRRLVEMAEQAARAGRCDRKLVARIESLCGKMNELIGEASPPGLIHGDVWSGNVLAGDGRVAGLIDPAIYYADPEVELAFITLFSTFGREFFERYDELRPIRKGFFETRKDLYNLYPLLVHTRLFGGGYLASVERTLGAIGF